MDIILILSQYFTLFLFYSFCGWIIEVFGELYYSKRFVNRGFLIGPVCPVYGTGALLITVLLNQYSNDVFALFGLSIIICGILEYFTSYLLEKLFNARWWDYSNKRFNIKGRICLSNLIWFGIAGVAIVVFINPIILNLIEAIPINMIHITFGVTLVVFITDIVISLTVVRRIRNLFKIAENEAKDSTAEISKKVREILLQESMVYRRMLEAFPHVFADRLKHVANEIKTTAIETKEKTITTINTAKEKTSTSLEKSKRLTKYRIKRIKRTINRRKIVTIGKHEKEVENEFKTKGKN